MSYTLQQLRHFAAVAETGSVSRAAERCHISQPSLSASLKNLSEAIDSALFTRQRTGVFLTPEGERFLRHAHQILMDVDRATQDMIQKPDTLSGSVTIGVTETISGYLVPTLLMQARRLLPLLEIRIVEDEREGIQQALLRKEIDFALLLISNIDPVEEIAIKPLLRSSRKLWTSVDHPLLEKTAISLRDVVALDYILLDKDEHVQTAEKYWANHKLRPNVVFRSKSPEAVRSMVANGLGVTILSDLTYREWSHEGGRIVRRSLSDSIPTMDVGFAFRRGEPLLPAVVAIADFLRSFVGTPAKKNLPQS
jgi:DNA-binding transcriptional LysR family regulator